ncbi:autotransporter-associated beta strand repeat-containing protein [uncultured Bosea sp.]|uniref:beta strand repeat-containing protein n=1 Tax=uncultured Bosea sp. TaxID=211457 RepID=UPI0025DD08E9|nr:autotransporter-associated beta strand repeat-containing protein [uncultured Bosea sp.]
MTLRSRGLPMCSLAPCNATTPMTSLPGSNAVSPGSAAGDIRTFSNSLARRRRNLCTTTSRVCLVLALSLGAGLSLWPQAVTAQQITQGGGNGSGNAFGLGGIAGGGGGSGDRSAGISGGDGGSAAQTPGGSATAGSAGANDVGGSGGAGGAPGAPNDLAAGGGGGGGHGGYDPGFPSNGGAGGAGGGGNLLTTTSPLSLGSAYAGGTGATGSFGGSPAGSGGGGGGGGGLILTGAGVTMNTNGFAVSGGAGGGGAGAGGGGAGLVLLNGGTITVAAGAGGTSVIAGGQGSNEYEGGHGGAGLFLYNGGSLSHQAGSITGGAGGGWAWAGSGGAGVLSNLGIIDNRAAIAGGKGGDSNAGGTGYGRGGAGLEAWGGSIANTASGTITGGAGGNQSDNNPVYVAGVGGAGIVFRDGQTASLDNAGAISGGNGGIAVSSSHGVGGAGIVGAASGGISIVNSGLIAGGLSGDGVTRANAVELFGSNNRFEIRAGARTDGDVVVQGGGANNVLALGGAADGSVNIGNLVNSHTGFTACEKTGSSTWTLSGAGNQNWAIREGILSGNSSSMAGDLAFDTGVGTRGVVFVQGTGGIYSGTISGDGSFTLTGAAGGGLTLTRAQSYTGMTTINAGTLRMGVANALTASAGLQLIAGSWDLNGYDQTVKGLAGNPGTDVALGSATLTVDNAGNTAYWGSISGAGGLTKTGSGIFELNGTNTYSGATNVASGFMRIGTGGSLLNSAAVNISNGAHLSVGGPSALSPTVAVSLTGAGSLLSLTAGQSIGSLAGTAGTGVWLDPGMMLTTGGNHTSTVFSGNLGPNGEGSLTKIGTGAFTLAGTNGYTGATTVNAGSLIVNGSIASSSGVTVAAGAALGGTGVVPTTVLNGGTLSPGNSPGTLTVNGNLTFNPGSIYLAEIQGANADRVNVTGTAALAGTLRLAPLGGAYVFNSAYTLLSAAGGRTGTFSPVDTTGTFGDGVTTTVSYTANDVLLTLAPRPLTPGIPGPPGSPTLGVTHPRNAYAIARSIDTAVENGGDPSSLFGIYNLPAAAIPAAVNSLSGEVHTAAPAMALLISAEK